MELTSLHVDSAHMVDWIYHHQRQLKRERTQYYYSDNISIQFPPNFLPVIHFTNLV